MGNKSTKPHDFHSYVKSPLKRNNEERRKHINDARKRRNNLRPRPENQRTLEGEIRRERLYRGNPNLQGIASEYILKQLKPKNNRNVMYLNRAIHMYNTPHLSQRYKRKLIEHMFAYVHYKPEYMKKIADMCHLSDNKPMRQFIKKHGY